MEEMEKILTRPEPNLHIRWDEFLNLNSSKNLINPNKVHVFFFIEMANLLTPSPQARRKERMTQRYNRCHIQTEHPLPK